MKEKTDVLQGTLALMVLKTLDVLGPLHGYGIARRIAFLTLEQPWPTTRSDGLMLFTSSTRAPSLSALAQFGIGEIRTL